jgi:hypothetical protein
VRGRLVGCRYFILSVGTLGRFAGATPGVRSSPGVIYRRANEGDLSRLFRHVESGSPLGGYAQGRGKRGPAFKGLRGKICSFPARVNAESLTLRPSAMLARDETSRGREQWKRARERRGLFLLGAFMKIAEYT